MITNPTMSVSQVAGLVTEHMAAHCLAEPASLTLTTHGHHEASLQLSGSDLADKAQALLAWANTLSSVQLSVWRPGEGKRVHLHACAPLAGPLGTVALLVYAGVPFDPDEFGALEPDQERPVSFDELTRWAAGTSEVAA